MQLDKEDIRSYEQRSFFDSQNKKEITPLSIFFAVLAAIIVAWFLRAAYIEWQIRQAVSAFNQQMQIVNQQTQEQIRNIQLRNKEMKQKSERDAYLKAEEIKQKNIDAQKLDLDRRAQIVNQSNERAKKEEAWSHFYKPTRGCEKDNPERDLINCGNDYARARKRFEYSWQSTQ